LVIQVSIFLDGRGERVKSLAREAELVIADHLDGLLATVACDLFGHASPFLGARENVGGHFRSMIAMAWSIWWRAAIKDASFRRGLISTPSASMPFGFRTEVKPSIAVPTSTRISWVALKWVFARIAVPPSRGGELHVVEATCNLPP